MRLISLLHLFLFFFFFFSVALPHSPPSGYAINIITANIKVKFPRTLIYCCYHSILLVREYGDSMAYPYLFIRYIKPCWYWLPFFKHHNPYRKIFSGLILSYCSPSLHFSLIPLPSRPLLSLCRSFNQYCISSEVTSCPFSWHKIH